MLPLVIYLLPLYIYKTHVQYLSMISNEIINILDLINFSNM